MENSSGEKGVHDRLLEAAEELFCRRGFNETSVRDIASAAGCNIASVNYYFGGKENLYLQIWRRELALVRENRLASIDKVMSGGHRPSLEELLTSYAYSVLDEKDRGFQFMHLMARELIDPHLPRGVFMEEMAAPIWAALSQALIDVCPGLKRPDAEMTVLSVMGQLVHMVHIGAVFTHRDQGDLSPLDVERTISHIVRFSAAGIRAYACGDGENR